MRSFITPLLILGAALSRVVLLPLYLLSGLVPRHSNRWVFGSWGGQRYADNAAAFFEYCREHLDHQCELVWISHRAAVVREVRASGARAYLAWSPAGLWLCATAGLHLFDCFAKDTNFWVSGGALRINLWSGVPLKSFERDIDNPGNRYFRLFHGPWYERLVLGLMMPWHVQRPDLIIATSAQHADIVAHAFNVPAQRIAVTGYPRNISLLSPSPSLHLPASFANGLAAGRKQIVYLPTFRDSGRCFLDFDWGQLDTQLTSLEADLFIKFHPLDASAVPKGLSRVHSLARDVDIYPLLSQSHVLISDYSSVIWDFMLLGRPIIYFVPDHEEFQAESRRLMFDLDEIAVGPVCRNFPDLLAALAEVTAPDYADWRATSRGQAILASSHRYTDMNSSARVLAAISRRLLPELPGLDAPEQPSADGE